MKLRIWQTGKRAPIIRPAPKARDWLDNIPDGHPYKCLPLSMGSMYGWQVCMPNAFCARWDGGNEPEAIEIGPPTIAESHFGNGILTFFPGFVFRMPKGWDILVTGPLNAQKHYIQPLTGIIEYDSGVHTWSMNWRFVEKGKFTAWAKDEPFCQFWPVKRDALEAWKLDIEPLPEQHRAEHEAWVSSRLELNDSGGEWSKDYYRKAERKRMNLCPVLCE